MNGVEGVQVDFDGEAHHEREPVKNPEGKAKRQGKKVKTLRARKGKLFGWSPKNTGLRERSK